MRDLARRGLAAFLTALAAASEPAEALTVSQWAQRYRVVSAESGSPYPGKWDNARAPYLAEPMDKASLLSGCSRVVFVGSAQIAKSQLGLNAIGAAIHLDPCPVIVMLPGIEETKKYNQVHLGTMIDATPALQERVAAVVSRDERGSTTTFKSFRGGYLQIVNAASSKGLQMISARLRVYEEPTGYPGDVGGRGSPTAQADARSKAWKERGDKVLWIGTPGLKGECLITAEYETTDQRRLYVPCPSCGECQLLDFARMKPTNDERPYDCHFICVHGCVIEHADKRAMVARGKWVPTYESGDPANPAPPAHFPLDCLDTWHARPTGRRDPGYHLWQAYSPFIGWDDTWQEWRDAQGKPRRLKAFYQQTLGQVWEEQVDVPKAERLLERRIKWPARRIPAGVIFLTGSVDVQGDRLEWNVWGFDRDLGSYLIDRGVIKGDPTTSKPWVELAEDVIAWSWRDAWGKPRQPDLWGIDAGYLSQSVYRFVYSRAAEGKVWALDGLPGWKRPALGTPSRVDVDFAGEKQGVVQLWPVGTWDQKSELYGALRLTIEGPGEDGRWPPGACYFSSEICDLPYFEQLTAEALLDVEVTSGRVEKRWTRMAGRANEAHDLAVYCRALAHHLADGLVAEDWDELARLREGPAAQSQLDLAQLWGGGALLPPGSVEAPIAAETAPGAPPQAAEPGAPARPVPAALALPQRRVRSRGIRL